MKYSPYKAYKAPTPKKTKPNNGNKQNPKPIILAVIGVLLAVTILSILIVILFPIITQWQRDNRAATDPFIGEDIVGGIFVDPFNLYQLGAQEEDMQPVTTQLIDYCTTNGINTIFLYAKSGESVAYTDKNFESPFNGYDPLHEISTAAAQQGIATVAVVDLYGADELSIDADVVGGRYSPSDERYAEVATQTLDALIHHYSISAIALSNITEVDSPAIELLLTNVSDKLNGRSIGIIPGDLFSAGYADFALLNAQILGEAASIMPDVALYAVPDGLSDAQFDYALFSYNSIDSYSGAVFGIYGDMDPAVVAKLSVTAQPQQQLAVAQYTLSTELQLTNPASGNLRQTSENCYIMGLSDPTQPLYMDGAEITRLSSSGSFGVLVSLDMGDNTFTFTQGDATVTAEIERYSYTSSGSSTTQHDGTQKANEGVSVEIVEPIASALSDASSDGNISETLRQGAVFEVVGNELTTRSGKTTYAYQMSSGDWVMAYNTKATGPTSLVCEGLTATAYDGGEIIGFTGLGAPAVYDERLGNQLIFTMYDVDFSSALTTLESFKSSSTLVDDITIETVDTRTVLTLTLSSQNPVWGHYVEYTDGLLNIDLVAAPTQPTGLPLDGFTIMIDAGHGDQDTGAPGIAGGISGPTEKELNLNIALLLEQRLTQLGAEVIMTRTDDTFLTLQERLTLSFTEKPHFFLSIHHNSIALTSDGNTAAGIEGYYFEETSKAFSEALTENIAGYTGRAIRGDFYNYFYVTRSTGAQSVLYEYGFVINPVEYDDLYSQSGVLSATYGTAEGFCRAVEEFYRVHSTAG